jgi:hypothetical protein
MKRLARADSHVKLQSIDYYDRFVWTLDKHDTHEDDTFKSFAYDMYNCEIELFDKCVVPCEHTAVNANGDVMWIIPDIEAHDCEGIAYEVEAFTE